MAVMTRTEVVRPAMCGHNSLFVGRIGDWTWDAVGAECGTDVLRARDPSGAPTYLSFYYYRIRGSRRFHLRTPAFGDRLRIVSGVFGFGSESVLTLHRITRDSEPEIRQPAGDAEKSPGRLDPESFYAFADDDCLYVENFNRWVTRSAERSNQDLVRSSPTDFRHQHLPTLPEVYSPRLACQRARTGLTFLDDADGDHRQVGPDFHVDYEVEPTRDLNGVGLLYFASYFSIVDWATLRWWRDAGRSDQDFLDRVAIDQQLLYLGNADAGSVIAATVRCRRAAAVPDREVLDVVLHERGTGRLLAVCTISILTGDTT
jgi:probable biosynthetic protein (TIGR04098 family)